MANPKLPFMLKQAPMRRMLYALSPLALISIWLYGLKSLAMLLVAGLVGWIVERLMLRPYREPVSQAVFVTTTILVLTLPPSLPLWMVALGSLVAVLFGKMVFGGFGRNVFNPAMVGRAFLYVSFGQYMTGAWTPPLTGSLLGGSLWPAGFAAWEAPLGDALTSATPLMSESSPEFLDLLIGTHAGSLGESSALLIILAGIYLVKTKAANWRIIVAGLSGFLVCYTPLWLAGLSTQAGLALADPLVGLLTGGALFGFILIATDPVSAANTQGGRWFYGALIGVVAVLIRVFSVWPEGMMFAILIGNSFSPIVDWLIRNRQAGRAAQ